MILDLEFFSGTFGGRGGRGRAAILLFDAIFNAPWLINFNGASVDVDTGTGFRAGELFTRSITT